MAGGGKFANGAVTGAFGYLFNNCAANPLACGPGDANEIYSKALGESFTYALDAFMKDYVGVTFYAVPGTGGEMTIGQGNALSAGGFFDTRGTIGLFATSSDTQGANISVLPSWSIGFQYGTIPRRWLCELHPQYRICRW